jgi:hypothetical protein
MQTKDGYNIIPGKQYWYINVVDRLLYSIKVDCTYINMVDVTSCAIITFGEFYPRKTIQIPRRGMCCESNFIFKSEINARTYLINHIRTENHELERKLRKNHGTLANIDTSVGNLSSMYDYPRKMYAWFSQDAFDFCGGCIYRDVFGREILITCVHEHPVYDNYKWSDKRFLGEVTDFIRCVNRRQW